MSNVPKDRKYARSHEWAREQADGTVEVGISDHAQQSLGDLVFVEVPEVGRTLQQGEACAVVESVKAASDVYAPVAGTVVAVNPALAQAPELVNQDPYGGGWIMRLKPSAALAAADLLDADGYAALAAAG
jgi:glycine cleavage system H protein